VAGITQAVYPVPRGLKTDLLDELLRRTDTRGVIVFARTKRGADRLARQLEKRGHSVAPLHGDRTQSQRERALRDLKRGRIEVLVATDIASRGIDVSDLSHVINFDVPVTPEDYVHRIGRTARAEATGDAFTLMAHEEERDLKAIERFIGKSILRVTIPDFDYKKAPRRRSMALPATADEVRAGAADAAGKAAVAAHRARRPSPSGPVHGRKPRRSSRAAAGACDPDGPRQAAVRSLS
jgi:ATP-dependent RNA helicase RhlE